MPLLVTRAPRSGLGLPFRLNHTAFTENVWPTATVWGARNDVGYALPVCGTAANSSCSPRWSFSSQAPAEALTWSTKISQKYLELKKVWVSPRIEVISYSGPNAV